MNLWGNVCLCFVNSGSGKEHRITGQSPSTAGCPSLPEMEGCSCDTGNPL